MGTAYDDLTALLRETATIASVRAALGWDQETMMPPAGGAHRAEEMSLLAALEHERLTSPKLADLLAACESDPGLAHDPDARANLREIRRDVDRARRQPTELVAEISRVGSLAVEAWRQARAASDFAAFRPWLEAILDLCRRKADCLGAPPGGEPYDALLDEYEAGATARQLDASFAPLRAALAPLLEAVAAAPRRPSEAPLQVAFPLARQQELSRFMAARIGFDFDAGRLDVSTHPFTQGLGPGDTRITSRYADDRFADALGSTLHETGHALYEQGLPKQRWFGLPLSQAAGLGVHESQSRLWENQVGRSLPFWRWAAPEARRILGAGLEPFTAEAIHGAVNRVAPSLIRVESDEVSYPLHVMLRFDLERAMVRGDLRVADLPAAWNERVRCDLGLEVPDDRRGCLQDIHWAAGAVGYFPTYAIGTLLAAQLWEVVRREFPELDRRIEGGDFRPLLDWLRERIHAHGRRELAADLCVRITGRPLGHDAFVTYLTEKLGPLYGI